jgi:hypothetical protein
MGLFYWETDAGSAGWVEVQSLRTKKGGSRCTAAVATMLETADSLSNGNGKPGCQYWDMEGQRWATIPVCKNADMFWDPVCQFWQAPPSCFTGTASILLMDGSTKLAMDVQVGDRLAATDGGPAATATTHTTVIGRCVQSARSWRLIKIDGLLISAVHRIVCNGQWVEPLLYPGAEAVDVDDEALYNFVVEGSLPIAVNDICVSTIGTYCEGSHDFQWPTHALWGSQKIVDILRQHPSWPEIYFGEQDNLIAVLKDPKFAEEYLVTEPENAHDLLRKHGWILAPAGEKARRLGSPEQ